ncbi:MAG: hypothetical protein RJA98_800 [Pseudomonadota bacterium]|jgi:predicted enzyme related to lactoylglutathione lyase
MAIELTTHALNWFEIPVVNMDRAQSFYEAVLGRPMRREAMGPDSSLAVFAYQPETGVGGALIIGNPALQPSNTGTLVYLNAEPSLDAAVLRAVTAGGLVLTPRVQLPDGMGCFAHVQDSEGNRVGLHALT